MQASDHTQSGAGVILRNTAPEQWQPEAWRQQSGVQEWRRCCIAALGDSMQAGKDLCSTDLSGLDVVVLVPNQQAAGAEAQPGEECHQVPLLPLPGLAAAGY